MEASGGRDAIEEIRSFHVSGSYELPDLELEGTIDLYYAKPDRLRMRVEIPGFGTIEQGIEGDLAWSIDPQLGPRLLEGDQATSAQRLLLRAFSVLPAPDAYREIVHEGFDTRNDERRIRLALTLRNGLPPITEWYDPDTGLLVAREERVVAAHGPVTITGTCGEYETHHGVLVATRWAHSAGGQRWVAKYASFDFNDVDDTVFALPEAIEKKLRARN